MVLSEYLVVGQAKGSTTAMQLSIFAKTEVHARKKFWYFAKKVAKCKSSSGDILKCSKVFEKKPTTLKNFGIFLRYDSRTATHNMFKEYRAMSRTEAVEQMYSEMAGRHRARAPSVQIIKVVEIASKDLKRPAKVAFRDSKVSFPNMFNVPRQPKKFQTTFKASRAQTLRN
ncbi:MAG: hypothetical protein MHM6MM_002190 [Cercozoa sp. M6MM]